MILIEKIVNLHIEKLPKRYYLDTSHDVQGLIAQGRTLLETFEIASDVLKKRIRDTFYFPMVIGVK